MPGGWSREANLPHNARLSPVPTERVASRDMATVRPGGFQNTAAFERTGLRPETPRVCEPPGSDRLRWAELYVVTKLVTIQIP